VAESTDASELKTGPVLATIVLAVLLVVMSVSSLNVALPSIGRALEASQSDLQWIIDGYAMVLAALLLPFGALGDRYGRKRFLVAGLFVLAAASIVAALVGDVGGLISARVVAGVGAAAVFPATLSTVTATFPPEQRGRAVGTWAAAASVGGIVGVLVSGIVIEAFDDYAAIFWLTGSLTALCFLLAAKFVPDSADPSHAHLDPPGTLLSVAAVGGLVLGITEGPVQGWSDPLAAGSLAVGVVAAVAFVLWELRTTTPLLDVRLFANRAFSTGSLSIFLQFFAAFGFFFIGAQYLAVVRGYGPLATGFGLLPLGLLVPPLSRNAPRLAARYGRGIIGGIGLSCIAAGFLVLTRLQVDSPYLLFVSGLVVFGAGMGLAAAPATEAIVGSLPAAKQGVASAVNDVSRELGGALGIAVIGSAFNTAYRAAVDSGVTGSGAPQQLVDVVRSSPAAAEGIAAQAGPVGEAILGVVQSSFMDGFHVALSVGAAAAAVGAVIVFWRGDRTGSRPASP
jgi:EmrB/QacA subfamily drug resistance transporter